MYEMGKRATRIYTYLLTIFAVIGILYYFYLSSNHFGTNENHNSNTQQRERDESKSTSDIESDRATSISGWVLEYGDRSPIGSARVQVFSDLNLITEAYSDNQGSYSIQVLNGGDYILKASKNDFGSRFRKLTVTNNREIFDLNFYLVKGSSLYGSARYTNGENLVDANIRLWSIQSPDYNYETKTDENGQFTFDDIHPGSGFEISLTLRSGVTMVQPVSSLIGGKNHGPIEFIVDPLSVVEGFLIVEATGQTVPGINVILSIQDNDVRSSASVQSDDNGKYSFVDIPTAIVSISSSATDYWNDKIHLNVESGRTYDNINLKLKPNAVLSGRLADENNIGLANAVVQLKQDTLDWLITDDNGKFQCANIHQSQCDISFYYEDQQLITSPEKVKIDFNPGEEIFQEFMYKITHETLRGYVYDSTRIGVPGVSVELKDGHANNKEVIEVAQTKEDGSFDIDAEISGLASNYYLLAKKDGYCTQKTPLSSANKTQDVRVIFIILDQAERIKGKVIDEQGNPQENIRVKAMSEFSPRLVYDSVTSEMGEFCLDAIKNGVYTLSAWNVPSEIIGKEYTSKEHTKFMNQAKITTISGIASGTEDVLLRLRGGGEVYLEVVDLKSKAPITNYSIQIKPEQHLPPNGDYRYINVIDAQGCVKISNLDFDTYFVDIRIGEVSIKKEQFVLSAATSPLRLHYEAESGIIVNGTVVEKETLLPIGDVHVQVESQVSERSVSATSTDKAGEFKIIGLQNGKYHFAFQATIGQANVLSSEFIEVSENMDPLMIMLETNVILLSGIVVDLKTNEPVSNATVMTNAQINQAITNNNGEFALSTSRDSVFNCSIFHEQYSRKYMSDISASEILNRSEPWIIYLDRCTPVFGNVVFSNAYQSFASKQVEIRGDTYINKVTTDASGQYYFSCVPSGKYVIASRLFYAEKGYDALMSAIDVKVNDNVAFDMIWPSGHQLSGVVYYQGVVVESAKITLDSEVLSGRLDSAVNMQRLSGSDGYYLFSNVPEGHYMISVKGSNELVHIGSGDLYHEILCGDE